MISSDGSSHSSTSAIGCREVDNRTIFEGISVDRSLSEVSKCAPTITSFISSVALVRAADSSGRSFSSAASGS